MSQGIGYAVKAGLYITRRTLGFVGVGSRVVWQGLIRVWQMGPGQWIHVMYTR